MLIYEPKGKAREYSPLALNLFSGCPHRCRYCYVPEILRIKPEEFSNNTGPRKTFSLAQLERDARKIAGSAYPVFLSFTSDPYPDFDREAAVTRSALEVLLKHHIPVIILSKGGSNWLRDLDVFHKFGPRIKIGATLTTMRRASSVKHEPNSSLPNDRLNALKEIHDQGLMTWASIEPVVVPHESIEAIRATLGYVDEYRIGKMSDKTMAYSRMERTTDWKTFLEEAVWILREAGKRFYVKEELRRRAGIELRDEEKDLKAFDTFCGNDLALHHTARGDQLALI